MQAAPIAVATTANQCGATKFSQRDSEVLCVSEASE